MNDLLHVLLGAALLSAGVLVSALADRIRQLRAIHREQARTSAPAREVRAPRAPKQDDILITAPGSSDVVAALMAAGYKKIAAMQAVAACTAREQSTPEGWTAAALRRCAGGAL